MGDYVSDDNFSLSGLTQEDPKYISVVQETSDEEDVSNLSAIFECARKLGGEVISAECDMSNPASSIHSNISDAYNGMNDGPGTPKRMRNSETNTVEEVCAVN